MIPGSGRSAEEGTSYPLQYSWAFLVDELVKNPLAMWETWVQSLGWEDTLKKGKSTPLSILFWPREFHGLWPTRLLCPWGFSRLKYWSGLPCLLPGDLPNPGIKPRSPTLQVDSLPSEPPGKPKNNGVDSLSLLQENFPTQQLYCRQIFYQLSYPGSPFSTHVSI